MNLDQMLDVLRRDEAFIKNVTRWEQLPERPARYGDIPEALHPAVVEALRSRGLNRLYTHQSEAIQAALQGQSTVVVTPTASGKTLCYNVPVVHSIVTDVGARALYLFPTKALAQDQLVEVKALAQLTGHDIQSHVYDGDTPASLRSHIRQAGQIIVTNPDMLHTGILPHHTRWVRLFENLKYVVIDELHSYRGVFGSHVANVIRRLRRLCQFYGTDPQFLCSSATIANPQQLAEKLTGQPVQLIDNNGAPRGEKHFIIYNPPVVTADGLRQPLIKATRHIAANLLKHRIQTIVFARSRLSTEVLVTYLKRDLAGRHRFDISGGGAPRTSETGAVTSKSNNAIRGYRGGYLPSERRAIERGLRSGDVLGVVSTNALELGIDIGQLQACVMAGYPGTIASSWQQAGRAGRRQDVSLAIMVVSSAPLDQYVATHPDYFFDASPEYGLINPDNLMILVSHLKCAAFELPFADDESFGVDVSGTQQILAYLEEEKIVRCSGDRWHWMSEGFPAEDISLRSAAAENIVIVDTTSPHHQVIGEIDRISAMTMLHTHAIYIHEGKQFLVDRLDWEQRRAYVHAVDVDYYTDANLAVTIRPIDEFKSIDDVGLPRTFGEIMTACKATIFKKIKLHTHENVGWGHIHLPEDEMHTHAYWVTVPENVASTFDREELQSALLGTAHLLESLAPMFLMCDPKDLRAAAQVRAPHTEQPTIFLYDTYPGGIGLAEKAYDVHTLLLEAAMERIDMCGCHDGCPSCVGAEAGSKQPTLRLLQWGLGAGTDVGAATDVGTEPSNGAISGRSNGTLPTSLHQGNDDR